MGYRFFQPRRFLMFVIPTMALVITGCSADRYFMVPKHNMEDLRTSVQTQRATQVTMENNATVRHEQLLHKSDAATQTILDAIATQVERPVCPPAAAPVCPAVAENQGRADLALASDRFTGELRRFRELAVLMAEHPVFDDLTAEDGVARADWVLQDAADKSGALALFYTDTAGTAVAVADEGGSTA